MSSNPFLETLHLKKYFPIRTGLFSTHHLRAVDDVSFILNEGESLGLVGESGSGKSTVARLIMRSIEPTGGSVAFMGQKIFEMDRRSLRKLRQKMAMIFQDASSALDPRMTIKDLIGEPLKLSALGEEEIRKRVTEALDLVNLPNSYRDRHPHELSGGEKQRVGIARALITTPKLVIADEPTSDLDVSIQAQILELIKNLVRNLEVTLVFISHNLAVVKYICSKVAVMYMGRLMELGSAEGLFRNPLHPYTQALCSAVIEPGFTVKEKRILLRDSPLSSIRSVAGCRFSARCPVAKNKCAYETPELIEVEPSHLVACHLS